MRELKLSVFLQHSKRIIERGETFKTLKNVMDICSEGVSMTSCTVECVFSSFKRIKTASRSSVLTSGLLTSKSDLASPLDFNEFIDLDLF